MTNFHKMKLFFSLFLVLAFTQLKAQIDPVKSADRILQRSAISTEKRLEQTANKEIDRKINQTLSPTNTKATSNSKDLKATNTKNSDNSSNSVSTLKTVKSDTKENQVKTTVKPAQKNIDTKAHGSLLPPSK